MNQSLSWLTDNHHHEYLPIMKAGFRRWQLPPIYWPRRPALDFTFTSNWFLHYLHLFWCFILAFLVFDIYYILHILYIIFCTISNVLCRGLVIFIYILYCRVFFFFIFCVHSIWCYWLIIIAIRSLLALAQSNTNTKTKYKSN